jgi:hypothetical protein
MLFDVLTIYKHVLAKTEQTDLIQQTCYFIIRTK